MEATFGNGAPRSSHPTEISLRNLDLTFTSSPLEFTAKGTQNTGSISGWLDAGLLFESFRPLLATPTNAHLAGRASLSGTWQDAQGGTLFASRLTAAHPAIRNFNRFDVNWDSASLAFTGTLHSASSPWTWNAVTLSGETPIANWLLVAQECAPSRHTFKGVAFSLAGLLDPLLGFAALPRLGVDETLTLALRGNCSPEQWTFDRALAKTGFAELDAQGALQSPHTAPALSLSGMLSVDFAALHSHLPVTIRDDMAISGTSVRPFRLTVPLHGGRRFMTSELNIRTDFRIPKIAAFGMVGENATLSVETENQGLLALAATAKVGAGNGAFNAKAHINLLDTPPSLTLAEPMRVLSDVKLTRDVVNQLLARAHPVLRDSIPLTGRVGATLERLYIPLQPEAQMLMTWGATLDVAEATFVADGVLADIAAALGLNRRDVSLGTAALDVTCKADRLFSNPITLKIGSETIRGAGEVAFGGTMNYRVELPSPGHSQKRRITVPLLGPPTLPRLDRELLGDN